MPLDFDKAHEQWARYVYARDRGHREFVAKANRCEDFFAGSQWDPAVVRELQAVKRPALTINKVLITLSSIFGEQIDTRAEISFKPRYSAPPQNADILTKVFRFISDENQLNWVRSDVFADGCITSRGYYDARLRFDRNAAGEVQITRLNPRMVLPDPDASDYDPEQWNDVIVTSWTTPDEIKLMYNEHDAKVLASRTESTWAFGYDSLDMQRDSFGGATEPYTDYQKHGANVRRSIRVLDRQHRVLDKMKFLVDPKSGDKMRVPDAWGRDEIAHAVQAGGLVVSDELGKRIRWTVTAEEFVLHDDWSPFKRFTVIPYFPHFRYGRTIGLVEGLLDPQELLNKTLSQELHVVNTMANSGWKVKSGAVANMTPDELEERGAQSGIVIEVNGDPETDVVKITPNQIPQGLDRLSQKAETYVKTVSGRGDNQLGLTRPDQSGKLTEEANKASDMSLRAALDKLERTDYILAHNILELVQNFYTDHRVMNITRDAMTGEIEQVGINVPDLASGEMLNDLSLGSYDAVVTSQTARRTLEESEFANAIGLREMGIPIPDRFMVENSNLRKKGEIIKAMDAEAASPEAQMDKKANMLGKQLSVAELKANVSKAEADAGHSRAKTAEAIAKTQQLQSGDAGEQAKAEAEKAKAATHIEVEEAKMDLKEREHQMKLEHMREEHALQMKLKQQDAAEKRRNDRITTAANASAAIISAKNGGGPKQPGQPSGGKAQPGGSK